MDKKILNYIKENLSDISNYDLEFEQMYSNNIIELLHGDQKKIEFTLSQLLNYDNGHMVKLSWLNNFNESLKDFGYIESFKRAGNLLVDHSKNVDADIMIYSVMYCYRHYIELILKNIIAQDNKDPMHIHQLIPLWIEAKSSLIKNSEIDNKNINILESIIKTLFQDDYNSMAFRYRKDKLNNDMVSNEFKIDLSIVRVLIEVFDTIVYCTYGINI